MFLFQKQRPTEFGSPKNRLSEALWSADAWVNCLTKSGTFLTEEEDENRLVLGRLMIHSYATLASRSVERNKFEFRLRPKFHLLHHLTIQNKRSRYNPSAVSCWMDEDAMKRWMRIKRGTHKHVATEMVVRRFVLGLRANLQRGLVLAQSSSSH